MTERDDNGRPAQWVTETEPEFDANERDAWYALWEYEQEVCPDCGNLRAICSDPETDWYPQRTVCWATATRENVDRRWRKKHEKREPDAAGFLPTDGTRIWASALDLTPDDDFL